MLSAQPVRCRTFVGRRNELAVLDGRRKALAQSSGSFVLVTGEPGIGKTRLLTEFLELTLDRRGRNVVNTECLQRAQQPLGPIRALVSKLANAVTITSTAATLPKAGPRCGP